MHVGQGPLESSLWLKGGYHVEIKLNNNNNVATSENAICDAFQNGTWPQKALTDTKFHGKKIRDQ